MRTARWIILGIFVATLLFLSLLEERAITELSYQQGNLYQEVEDLEKENTDLNARFDKTVNYRALDEWARKLRLAPGSGDGR